MAQGPDTATPIGPYLMERVGLWDQIVADHDLRPIPLDRLLGESHHYADALLRRGVKIPSPPILVSTVKLRKAGFGACYDSKATLRHWLGALAACRLIPPLD